MRSAKTSKHKLPCRRRVHLHKSASFKTIFEQKTLTNKTNCKNDHTMIEQSACGKTSTNITEHTPTLQILAFILKPVAWNFPGVPRYFCDMFFWTSEGHPLDRCWPPLGHPWWDFVLEDFKKQIAPNVKESRATNGTNHTFKKQAMIQNNDTDNHSKQIIFPST